jgi:hypothetical protein
MMFLKERRDRRRDNRLATGCSLEHCEKGIDMSNPLTVQVPVTQANQTIYGTVESFAAYNQRVTITLPDGSQKIFVGSGEFVQQGTFTFVTGTPGFYNFTVKVEYQAPGGSWTLSSDVTSASQVVNTLNYTVVFSEDSTDDDDNDSFVTLRWFYIGGGPV